jgi:hypothetical protein
VGKSLKIELIFAVRAEKKKSIAHAHNNFAEQGLREQVS